jgi:hypothetical protein
MLVSVSALVPRQIRQRATSSSFLRMELFSPPAAKYNGELIMPGLKQTTTSKVALPEGTKYGDVSADGAPALAAGLAVTVLLAAAVPYFLSIGESAQAQQRVREASDKSNPNNKFVPGNKNAVKPAVPKQSVVVGIKKKAGIAPASSPAPAAQKSSFSFSFGAKKAAPAPVPASAAAAKAKSSSFSFGAKKAAPAPAPTPALAAKAKSSWKKFY